MNRKLMLASTEMCTSGQAPHTENIYYNIVPNAAHKGLFYGWMNKLWRLLKKPEEDSAGNKTRFRQILSE